MGVSVSVGPRQPSLLAGGSGGRNTNATTDRIELGAGSWLDWTPGWLQGADSLFEWCLAAAPWRGGERLMYDRVVAEPRLTATLPTDSAEPDALLVDELARALSHTYGRSLHLVFASFYRTGRDSVAWHGDRIRRLHSHPVIPVLSLGGPRTFTIRPAGGGVARPFEMYSGDLLVMGGTCQHHFEHAVPKRRRAAPRISLTFRSPDEDRILRGRRDTGLPPQRPPKGG